MLRLACSSWRQWQRSHISAAAHHNRKWNNVLPTFKFTICVTLNIYGGAKKNEVAIPQQILKLLFRRCVNWSVDTMAWHLAQKRSHINPDNNSMEILCDDTYPTDEKYRVQYKHEENTVAPISVRSPGASSRCAGLGRLHLQHCNKNIMPINSNQSAAFLAMMISGLTSNPM